MSVHQIGWSAWKHGVSRSVMPEEVYHRFAITNTTSGYTVIDTKTGDVERTQTLSAARAWAGIRVGERVVRREPGKEYQ